MLELRGSESKYVCVWTLEECLLFLQLSVSLSHSLCWFSQPEVMGTSLPGTGTLGWGAWLGTGISCSTVQISLLIFSVT